MTTTHPDPHTCPARGVQLATQAEIDGEIDHLFGMLELRLERAGYTEISPSIANMRAAWQTYERDGEALCDAIVAEILAAAAPASPA